MAKGLKFSKNKTGGPMHTPGGHGNTRLGGYGQGRHTPGSLGGRQKEDTKTRSRGPGRNYRDKF